ncbi:MAG TPA: hypothetical protein VMN57_02725 [Anaerolineales bacterium]|nr:hypothetical protein [Anaerolineales bacterium]
MSRWIKFLIAIVIGVAIGLFYSWTVNPVRVVDSTPDSLRLDYRADYVLMVAEVYQLERDPDAAAQRLGRLGTDPVVLIVQQAVVFAETAGYPEIDLNLLVQLRDALQTWNPSP